MCPNPGKVSSLESDQKSAKQIAEESVIQSEVLLQYLEQINIEKDYIVELRGVIQKEKDGFQNLLQGETTIINALQKNIDRR